MVSFSAYCISGEAKVINFRSFSAMILQPYLEGTFLRNVSLLIS